MVDGLPGGGRRSQPTVLVSGRARELLRRVPLQLLAERADRGDAVVVVTTRDDPGVAARRLTTGIDAITADRVALVDCTTKAADGPSRPGDLRWAVPSPVSFAETTRAIDDALSELAARDVERVHFLFDTLTTQCRLADPDVVLQHAHDVAMTVGGKRGLGTFTVEHAAVTDREFGRLKHLVDAHVEVRRAGDDAEVRWTGLLGGSDGWVALADTGLRFDALGTNLG
jgi:KaiC/GvpD/RAD55 family RecA-like ATPase